MRFNKFRFGLMNLVLSLLCSLCLYSSVFAGYEDPVRYVVTLATSTEPEFRITLSLEGVFRTYITNFRRKGVTWYRLRLGFFTSRKEAEALLPNVKGQYPRAWVTRVSKREKKHVMSGQIASQLL